MQHICQYDSGDRCERSDFRIIWQTPESSVLAAGRSFWVIFVVSLTEADILCVALSRQLTRSVCTSPWHCKTSQARADIDEGPFWVFGVRLASYPAYNGVMQTLQVDFLPSESQYHVVDPIGVEGTYICTPPSIYRLLSQWHRWRCDSSICNHDIGGPTKGPFHLCEQVLDTFLRYNIRWDSQDFRFPLTQRSQFFSCLLKILLSSPGYDDTFGACTNPNFCSCLKGRRKSLS